MIKIMLNVDKLAWGNLIAHINVVQSDQNDLLATLRYEPWNTMIGT